MTLVQSWVDSLTLLKPKNLQLFVMVTIKSIIEAYKLYFRYFWWLLLVLVALVFIAPNYMISLTNMDRDSIVFYAQITGISRLLYGILFLAVCFITRPSILQKDLSYLFTQYKKFVLYWLCWGALLALFSVVMKHVQLFQVSSYLPGYIFLILFFADSDGSPKSFLLSLWNALKMIVYNFPLLLVMAFCFYVPVYILYKVIFLLPLMKISPLMKNMLGALLLPVGVCTYTNIYIKKLHDQFDLYFNKAQ